MYGLYILKFTKLYSHVDTLVVVLVMVFVVRFSKGDGKNKE